VAPAGSSGPTNKGMTNIATAATTIRPAVEIVRRIFRRRDTRSLYAEA
jgi:hypothetical protein